MKQNQMCINNVFPLFTIPTGDLFPITKENIERYQIFFHINIIKNLANNDMPNVAIFDLF